MKSEMYSGARLDRLMKCSNAVLSAFWNAFSLLKDVAISLRGARGGPSLAARLMVT
jgi:hypothetical protein